jgi:hypothetical protein
MNLATCDKYHYNLVEMLEDDMSLMNERDEYGNTMLHLAVLNDSACNFEYLLENCPLDLKNDDGDTALDLAIATCNGSFVGDLLERDWQVNEIFMDVNKRHVTLAIDLWWKYDQCTIIQIVEMLLFYSDKCNKNIIDNDILLLCCDKEELLKLTIDHVENVRFTTLLSNATEECKQFLKRRLNGITFF